jgi:hypothetical protein
MNFNKMALAYLPEQGIVAGVVSVNLIEQTVTLNTDEGEVGTFQLSQVEILPELVIIDESVRVFHKDVLITGNQELIMIEHVGNGEVVFHALNEELEIIESSESTPYAQEVVDEMSKGVGLDVVGNIHEIEVEDNAFDFNVKVVKDFNGQHFTYFYALNNKVAQEIDLIAVSFIGDVDVEGQDHERRTISYDVFLDSLEARTLVEVTNQEFANFIVGVFDTTTLPTLHELDAMDTSEPREKELTKNAEIIGKGQVSVDEFAVGEPTCKFCQNPETACDCKPW